MSLLLKNKFIILALMVLVILVLIRKSDQKVFKEAAKDAVEAASDSCNSVTLAQLSKLTSPYLIIDLDGSARPDSSRLKNSRIIPLTKLLDPENKTIYDQTKGALVLFSNDLSTSSKAWVILNQLGYKHVLLLTPDEDPEALKYKFQPDTTAKLEQDSI